MSERIAMMAHTVLMIVGKINPQNGSEIIGNLSRYQ